MKLPNQDLINIAKVAAKDIEEDILLNKPACIKEYVNENINVGYIVTRYPSLIHLFRQLCQQLIGKPVSEISKLEKNNDDISLN